MMTLQQELHKTRVAAQRVEAVLRDALWWAKNSGKTAEELIEMKWVHEAEGLFKEGPILSNGGDQ